MALSGQTPPPRRPYKSIQGSNLEPWSALSLIQPASLSLDSIFLSDLCFHFAPNKVPVPSAISVRLQFLAYKTKNLKNLPTRNTAMTFLLLCCSSAHHPGPLNTPVCWGGTLLWVFSPPSCPGFYTKSKRHNCPPRHI